MRHSWKGDDVVGQGVPRAVAHICAASDALIGHQDERSERAAKLLDDALNELAPHEDNPEVFRFVEAWVPMKLLDDDAYPDDRTDQVPDSGSGAGSRR